MSDDTLVYEIGDVETLSNGSLPPSFSPTSPQMPQAAARASCGVEPSGGLDVAGSLSLFVPGAGRMIRGDIAVGLFFLSSLAFLGSLAWAIVVSLDRLPGTLTLLGLPAAAAVWSLAAIYVMAAALYLANVVRRGPHWPELGCSEGVHPVLAGIASAIIPGWGQLLNGNRKRAAMFLGGLWVVAAAWLLSTPAVATAMDRMDLYLPHPVPLFYSAAVRWTMPAVLWTLAVYDATSSAATARQAGRPR